VVATEAHTPDTVVGPAAEERAQLLALGEHIVRLEAEGQAARLVGADGEEIVLPPSALRALRLVVDAIARGAAVPLVPPGDLLTTQQAADLLHVSRPFLVRKLLGKEIPFEKVGSHRRVRVEDVLVYRERRAGERRQLLDEMTAAAQDVAGGYR
jgi:excisionase family DNA binding protein